MASEVDKIFEKVGLKESMFFPDTFAGFLTQQFLALHKLSTEKPKGYESTVEEMYHRICGKISDQEGFTNFNVPFTITEDYSVTTGIDRGFLYTLQFKTTIYGRNLLRQKYPILKYEVSTGGGINWKLIVLGKRPTMLEVNAAGTS
ncbi:hypothetical protein A2767_00675 [Candidatus Roizmanbacteria bacterium RIFCSPHIGHO2_01_FULL_35_10]|uniref:Uncharacterized protein n=1 Tax=Candidatus Roizmanbacteria bacterium RIFCSPLOWO2_01_FULL_35_13 TaxID=1802055 RepID=A0A1F7I913_9BACT|nr:MAG: hypothetical protein A2767_00675 [Candidatus Roizmanbacteria bacterium RIFCSPHIGHO2_01_FULL_35_10]OGK39853.1 MAG: hypothetical protein A3A74_03100 [Candidatus Roizmanbacteria bacterium RIFCSPLOWO2_01_FULL_35_13]